MQAKFRYISLLYTFISSYFFLCQSLYFTCVTSFFLKLLELLDSTFFLIFIFLLNFPIFGFHISSHWFCFLPVRRLVRSKNPYQLSCVSLQICRFLNIFYKHCCQYKIVNAFICSTIFSLFLGSSPNVVQFRPYRLFSQLVSSTFFRYCFPFILTK